MIITIYSDPQHGWGKVNKALLHKLGIADKISSYSYMREGKVYLEEDVDLNILVMALVDAKMPFRFDYRFTDKQSKIRGYDSYALDQNACPKCLTKLTKKLSPCEQTHVWDCEMCQKYYWEYEILPMDGRTYKFRVAEKLNKSST